MLSTAALRTKVIYALLGVVMLFGLGLRTWNVNFDGGLNVHPDERSITCFYAPTIGWPSSVDEFLDPRRSPLNPLWDRENDRRRSFTYGHFPLYLGILSGELLSELAAAGGWLPLPPKILALMEQANSPCAGVAVAGRLLMALLDTATIGLLFLLGRRLYGAAVGLLAAAFYACAAQAVQLSHFFAMDPASATFVVLAVYGGVLMAQDRFWRGVVWSGMGSGLAIAAKFSAAPILAVPVVAALIVWRTGAHGWRLVAGALLALLLACAFFILTSPYAALDWENFMQATLVEQGRMVRGLADLPYTRQYRNTTPYLYFMRQQVVWGLGWPLGLLALAGSGWALAKAALLRARPGELVVWTWLIPYFGVTGAFLAKFNRYMSPVLPFALLFAAGLVGWLSAGERSGERGETRRARLWSFPGFGPRASRVARLARSSKIVPVLLIGAALGGGLFWSLAYVHGVYGHEHTWVAASRWVYANAPAGSVILWELWDDPLPKRIPGEAGLDMGSHGLRHIDWSPYEEDTGEKYAILKRKLREADYVIYSSKRIYESVDELPERYPLTIRYYELMFGEQLGFVQAAEFTSPPRLLGWVFADQEADESWSLYDHPRVSIFAKQRELSDAEFDALLEGSWEGAIPWHRGREPPLTPFLNILGLGSSPESQEHGLINIMLALLQGREIPDLLVQRGPRDRHGSGSEPSLLLATPLSELPLVDEYRWNVAASANPWLAVGWWWLVVSLLGWIAWPLAFLLFRRLRDRGYLVAKTLGWLLTGWLLWLCASLGLAHNTVRNAWLVVVPVALISAIALVLSWRDVRLFLRRMWGILLVGEGLFAAAFVLFVLIRMANPDIWQPWYGGEKFMEFAFLNGILRSPSFPPLDPHFAGGYINYYYYGIYLVGYLVKLTGIYAEVAFNLAIPTLFALTVLNAFCVAYSAVRMPNRTARIRPWHEGIGAALLAPLFVTIIGNLAGFAQIAHNLIRVGDSGFQNAISGTQPDGATSYLPDIVALFDKAVHAAIGLWRVLTTDVSLPGYDFWSPSRVIPHSINEFPYWSFTYADLHPHMIGIPFSVFFLALVLALLNSYDIDWRRPRHESPNHIHHSSAGELAGMSNWFYGLLLLGGFTFTLSVLAVVNLWELPTYFGLGMLALAMALYRGRGRLRLPQMAGVAVLQLAGVYLLFLPFFRNYTNVAVSGVGAVRAPDELGLWIQIWGFFAFILFTWLLGQFTHLPRFARLHRLLVARPTAGYLTVVFLLPLLALVALILLIFTEQVILALCLPFLALSLLLMWRRGRSADTGALCALLLTATGLAILAGTQVIYLKDFMQGGDAYRMNTLFKFFSQVWVLWGVAAAIALPQIFARLPWPFTRRYTITVHGQKSSALAKARSFITVAFGYAWAFVFLLLFLASLAYPLWGTPARLAHRFPGWRPEIGTLDGMAYMENGVYYWPDGDNAIELRYDWEAIQWLLANVRGNVVVVESAQVDYYRAGGTRVASLTGLSGLMGMHEGEQRYGQLVDERRGWLNEFWNTDDIGRIQQLIAELGIGLIYVGQLERHQHPDAVDRLAQLEATGSLQTIYQNQKVTIYAVPSQMMRTHNGIYTESNRATMPGGWEVAPSNLPG